MLRVCVVGSGGVGKSCVTIRFLKNEFNEYYDPTMEETYKTVMTYRGRQHHVEIVDTAGQEEFTTFLDSSLSTGDAFMILYAINSLSSWNDLQALRSKIFPPANEARNSTQRIPCIIVGNKKDLENDRDTPQETAEEYAASIRVPYIETSAKTGFNIHEAFELIMSEIDRVRPDLLQKPSKSARSVSSEHRKKDCRIA
ncbi:ras-related protein Rap1-like isoform X2 [Hydractinia symbiolongicarpus]|nr:ras-related protein Rap1-like isoform X2 [Hydractinia symbiolongicarpus]